MCLLNIEILIKFKPDVVSDKVSVSLNKLNEFMILIKVNLNLMLN